MHTGALATLLDGRLDATALVDASGGLAAGRLVGGVAAGVFVVAALEVRRWSVHGRCDLRRRPRAGQSDALGQLGAAEALITRVLEPLTLSGVIFAFFDALTFTGAPVPGAWPWERAGRRARNLAKAADGDLLPFGGDRFDDLGHPFKATYDADAGASTPLGYQF